MSQYKKMENGQKLNKLQSEALYQRLMTQENIRQDRLNSCKMKHMRKEEKECTFQPKTNYMSGHQQERSKSPNFAYSRLGEEQNLTNYRGMPFSNQMKPDYNQPGIFERSEDFLQHTREKRLLLKKQALKEKEQKEMENCSFRPKIHNDSYLKKRKIKRNSKIPGAEVIENSPTTLAIFEAKITPFGRRIGSKEYLELEFTEQEEKSHQPSPALNNKSVKQSKRNTSMTPTRNKSKSQNQSLLEFRTPNKTSKPAKMLNTPRNKSQKNSVRRQSKSSNQLKYKRSIVVLNEFDEFEDIEVYIAKMKAKNKIKRKGNKELQESRKRKERGFGGQSDYLDMQGEFEIEEIGIMDDQEQEMSSLKFRKLKRSSQEGEQDKENLNLGNLSFKPRGADVQSKEKNSKGSGVELFNNQIISENMTRLIKKTKPSMLSSSVTPKFETVLTDHPLRNMDPTSKRRKKKKLSKFDETKEAILFHKREEDLIKNQTSCSKSKSARELPVTDEDLIENLQKRYQNLQFTFKNSQIREERRDDFFEPLTFSSGIPQQPKRGTSSNKIHKKERDFLIINGEKIYFNESTISTIVNVDRVSRLTNLKNNTFKSNAL